MSSFRQKSASLAALTLLLFAGLSSPAVAQTSQDLGFGINTLARAGIAGQNEEWFDLTTQPDGKIVAVGSRVPTTGTGRVENFFVARFLPSGVLDTTFNGTGTFEFDFGVERLDRATSVNILPDGKILIGGNSLAAVDIPNQSFVLRTATSDVALIRLNADGTLDTTFGVSGAVRTDLSNLRDDTVARVLPLADGSIRVVGTSTIINGSFFTPAWSVAAFDANGSLNTSFGSAGRVTISFPLADGQLAARDGILLNGKILITGSVGNGASVFVASVDAASGQRDPSFGVNGIATVNLPVFTNVNGQNRQGWSLAAQPDGKVLVVGDGAIISAGSDFFEDPLLTVSRLNADGSTDATFNAFPNDTLVASFASIAVRNGSIVVAYTSAPRLTLASNGAITGNFGSFLAGTNPNPFAATPVSFTKLAFQANGGLLAAGRSNGDAAIARFTFDGSQSTPPVVTPPDVITPPPPPPPPAVTVPLAPTDFSAPVVQIRNVRLQWRDNATNETSYLIQRSTSADFSNPEQLAVFGANSNGFTDTTARARTTYFYRVNARNSAGSAASQILQVTTPRR